MCGAVKTKDKTVMCCNKGVCGSHTEADLEDLEDHEIRDDYLKEARMKSGAVRWEWVAERCWGCCKKL